MTYCLILETNHKKEYEKDSAPDTPQCSVCHE